MIRLADELSVSEVERFGINIMTARIGGLVIAYGADGGLEDLYFYRQTDDGGRVRAIVAVFCGHATVAAGDDADFGELSEFLKVVSAEVTAFPEVTDRLGFDEAGTVEVLEYRGISVSGTAFGGAVDFPSTDDVYRILKAGEDGDILLPDRESFCADLSHRMRHGAAVAKVTPSAAAVCGFMTDCSALITGVSVLPGSRGTGEGRRVLSLLIDALAPRRVFVTASGNVSSFYKKCGFRSAGTAVTVSTSRPVTADGMGRTGPAGR